MSYYELEPLCRVWDDSAGVCVEIRCAADNPEWLEIYTAATKKSEEYFGTIQIAFQKEYAKKIATAILKQISLMEEFEQENKEGR